MEVFVARQPIFNKNKETVAYELLFRNNNRENNYSSSDGNKATLDVISNSFCSIGIEKVTKGKKAFINFTEDLLKTDILSMLSPEVVVVEILETVEPTYEIEEICKNLKERGYIIALDDFVFDDKYSSILKFADIIKVDFKQTKGQDRKDIFDKVKPNKIKFLAEKIETLEEYNEALSYGYSYFQGYYFSKPVILSSMDIPVENLKQCKIIQNVNYKKATLEELENLIKTDVALSYKLLKLMNSSTFSLKNEIYSIKQAMSLLGEEEIIKWLYIVIVKTISTDKPSEMINSTLVRAKFGELIADKIGMKEKAFDAYIMGIISRMDYFLNISLEKVFKEIFVSKEIKEALTKNDKSILSLIYRLVVAYEKGKWNDVLEYIDELNIEGAELADMYISAIDWVNEILVHKRYC